MIQKKLAKNIKNSDTVFGAEQPISKADGIGEDYEKNNEYASNIQNEDFDEGDDYS